TDFFLDFTSQESSSDNTGHYAITYQNLYSDKSVMFRGTHPQGFILPENKVIVGIKPKDFLDNQKDLESFSISFWINPKYSSGERTVMTKGTYIKKKFFGLKIFQSGKKMAFLFSNMFYNSTNKAASFD